MNRRYVLADLPRTGLGNRLFVWGRAVVFAKQHGLPLVVKGWSKFLLGPWLRNEKSKRLYGASFRGTNRTWLNTVYEKLLGKGKFLQEPPYEINRQALEKFSIIRFTTIPHWDNYFGYLRGYEVMVKEELLKTVNPALIENLNQMQAPVIGVHVRMGDFRPLNAGEDFKKVGAVRTPPGYFKNIIDGIRKMHGSDLPVTIFSDGRAHELQTLLELPNVKMAEGNPDIIDLLLLSRSKVIITSAGSTFSYWAGFLSAAPLIMHPDHMHQPVRSDNVNKNSYEGPFDQQNGSLQKLIAAL